MLIARCDLLRPLDIRVTLSSEVIYRLISQTFYVFDNHVEGSRTPTHQHNLPSADLFDESASITHLTSSDDLNPPELLQPPQPRPHLRLLPASASPNTDFAALAAVLSSRDIHSNNKFQAMFLALL